MSRKRYTDRQKKNWLAKFEQSTMSAVAFCREHSLSYLQDLLKRLPSCSTDPTALRELLPANWAATHKANQKNQTTA